MVNHSLDKLFTNLDINNISDIFEFLWIFMYSYSLLFRFFSNTVILFSLNQVTDIDDSGNNNIDFIQSLFEIKFLR